MRLYKRIAAVGLCGLMLLGLWACKKEEKTPKEAPTVGSLQLLSGSELQVDYDASGKVTKAEAITENAKSLLEGYAAKGKKCTEAVAYFTAQMLDLGHIPQSGHLLIKQLEGAQNPKKEFPETVLKAAQGAAGEFTVFLASADGLDESGCIPRDLAVEIITLHLGADAQITVSDAPAAGYYTVVHHQGSNDTAYDFNALTGKLYAPSGDPLEGSGEPPMDESQIFGTEEDQAAFQ